MKVVIDIDEEMYKYICKHYKGDDTACLAVKNGLVLADNFLYPPQLTNEQILDIGDKYIQLKKETKIMTTKKKTCKDCVHSGLCYKENDYDNFPDRCGDFISDKVLEERPQGEWIETDKLWEDNRSGGMGYDYGYYFKCNKCGCEEVDKSNFCPNCGAKMLKGGKEE